MPKRKKPFVTNYAPAFTAEEHESRYKRDYEFNKGAPVRSPIKGWEYKYTLEHNSNAPPKEIRLAKGTPHRFQNIRTNNSYSKRSAIRRIKI